MKKGFINKYQIFDTNDQTSKGEMRNVGLSFYNKFDEFPNDVASYVVSFLKKTWVVCNASLKVED